MSAPGLAQGCSNAQAIESSSLYRYQPSGLKILDSDKVVKSRSYLCILLPPRAPPPPPPPPVKRVAPPPCQNSNKSVACHALTGPAHTWSGGTSYGSHVWPLTCLGCHKWSPQSTYGCYYWSALAITSPHIRGPMAATVYGPRGPSVAAIIGPGLTVAATSGPCTIHGSNYWSLRT